jgi:hypothetical protein
VKLTVNQIAEALELRQTGVYWENIASILNTDRNTLMRYVRAAERYGFSYWTDNPEDHSEPTIRLSRMPVR